MSTNPEKDDVKQSLLDDVPERIKNKVSEEEAQELLNGIFSKRENAVEIFINSWSPLIRAMIYKYSTKAVVEDPDNYFQEFFVYLAENEFEKVRKYYSPSEYRFCTWLAFKVKDFVYKYDKKQFKREAREKESSLEFKDEWGKEFDIDSKEFENYMYSIAENYLPARRYKMALDFFKFELPHEIILKKYGLGTKNNTGGHKAKLKAKLQVYYRMTQIHFLDKDLQMMLAKTLSSDIKLLYNWVVVEKHSDAEILSKNHRDEKLKRRYTKTILKSKKKKMWSALLTKYANN